MTTPDEIPDKITGATPPAREVPEVLTDVRDSLERLGKEVLATAEEVASGRRPVVPEGVRSSLSDLASSLATVADGAAQALQDWSRRLDPPDSK